MAMEGGGSVHGEGHPAEGLTLTKLDPVEHGQAEASMGECGKLVR